MVMATAILARAYAIAASVCDPEIPGLSIADLGVLRDIVLADGQVEVRITPTYSGCPAMHAIAQDIQAALAEAGTRHRTALPGVRIGKDRNPVRLRFYRLQIPASLPFVS